MSRPCLHPGLFTCVALLATALGSAFWASVDKDLPLWFLRRQLEPRRKALLAISAGPHFVCLRVSPHCRQGGHFSPLGFQSYDPYQDPEAGLTFFGGLCHSYDESLGNPLCPIRASLQWQPLCLSPSCRTFDLHVQIDVRQKSGWNWLDRRAPFRSFGFDIPWREVREVLPTSTAQEYAKD